MYLSNLYVMKFFHHIFHFYFKRIVNICLAQINCGAVIRLWASSESDDFICL